MTTPEYLPGSLEDTCVYPRVYELDDSKWLGGSIVLGILGAVVLAGSTSDLNFIGILIGASMMLFSICIAFWNYRYRFILSADEISVTSFLYNRAMCRENIAGKRVDNLRYANILVTLVPKDQGAKELKFLIRWETDTLFDQWLASVPDLDKIERDAVINSILENPDFGETRELRAAHVRRARTIAIVMTILTVASGVGSFFLPDAYANTYPLLIAALAVLPLIGVWLVATSNGLYIVKFHPGRYTVDLDDFQKERLPNLSAVLFLPPSFLSFFALSEARYMLDWGLASQIFLAGAIVSALAMQWVRNRTFLQATLVIFAALWGGSLAVLSNSIFDTSAPTVFRTHVKRVIN